MAVKSRNIMTELTEAERRAAITWLENAALLASSESELLACIPCESALQEWTEKFERAAEFVEQQEGKRSEVNHDRLD